MTERRPSFDVSADDAVDRAAELFIQAAAADARGDDAAFAVARAGFLRLATIVGLDFQDRVLARVVEAFVRDRPGHAPQDASEAVLHEARRLFGAHLCWLCDLAATDAAGSA